jgi:dipeptidyl aminopeptidase/acylaminoacyl peptidase
MTRPIELDDLPKLPVVGGPALSADGKLVAFPVQRWDLDGDRYRSEIWLARYDEPQSARPLTSGRWGDHSPAFSPDGRYLVFISDRQPGKKDGEKSSGPVDHDLWLLDLTGGEAVRLTRLPGNCSSPAWSPDGSRLAFLFQPRDPEPPAVHDRIRHVLESAGETLPEDLETAKPPEKIHTEDKKQPPIVRRITRLHWREDGKGFLPARRTQLWTLDVSSLVEHAAHKLEAAAPGNTRLRRLTAGPYDHSWPTFSPDGSRIALVANRSPEPDHTDGLIDLWLVPADSGAAGGGNPEHAHLDDPAEGIADLLRVPTPDGPVATPAWSPDGQQLAYLGHATPLDMWGITNMSLWTVPVPGASGGGGVAGEEAARDLIPGFDRPVESVVVCDMGEIDPYSRPVWRQRNEIVFHATDGGCVGIYAVSPQGGEPRTVHQAEQAVGNLVGDASGERLAFVATEMLEAPEVFTLEGDSPPRRLSQVSAGWRREFDLSEAEHLVVRVGEEGHDIEGWLLKPPDFDPAKRYPLILQIHGGPAASYGHALYFELQLLAARGYCVLFTNPRGSQGYGFRFGSAIRHDLAAPAHRDLMAAVDEIAGRDYIDQERLAVTGGSWGGYMTNWVITQTDRFRTAITQRCVSDLESDFGTSDFGYDTEWMLGGPPWTHREAYTRCSPLTYVESINTPLLIIHSEEDWRCPPLQGEMLFQALKILRREVEMVRFPGEPHGLSRSGTPSRRLARLRVMLEWFEKRLAAASGD